MLQVYLLAFDRRLFGVIVVCCLTFGIFISISHINIGYFVCTSLVELVGLDSFCLVKNGLCK